MYDKVQRHWRREIGRPAGTAGTGGTGRTGGRLIEAQDRLAWTTDMAVVVSQGQNEIVRVAAKGLDIRPHRKRMVEEDLDEKFKDPDDPCGWSSSAPCG
jgi:type I restriction enzyme, R subunit